MSEYSAKVIEHFRSPKNVGTIEDADGIGEVGDPDCGDFMKVFIKLEDNIIVDVKYQIRGCPASIACASVMTELALGRNLDDAMIFDENEIVEALDGLPEQKLHCSNLGAAGLKKAVMDHFERFIARRTTVVS